MVQWSIEFTTYSTAVHTLSMQSAKPSYLWCLFGVRLNAFVRGCCRVIGALMGTGILRGSSRATPWRGVHGCFGAGAASVYCRTGVHGWTIFEFGQHGATWSNDRSWKAESLHELHGRASELQSDTLLRSRIDLGYFTGVYNKIKEIHGPPYRHDA